MGTPGKLIELHLQAKTEQLQLMRSEVRKLMETQHYFPSQTVDRIVLALDEACSNIIRHAYGMECEKGIILEISKDREKLIFRLTDFAAPVDRHCLQPPARRDTRPGGLGIHIINEVMDSVAFVDHPQDTGNILEMHKRIDHSQA